MPVRTLEAVVVLLLREGRQVVPRVCRLLRADRPGLGHAVDDVVVARDHGLATALGVGVVARRLVEHGGEGCRLPHVELGGRLVEVGARRHLDAVGAVAEVDRVEVALQDLLLAQLVVDLDGEDGLADLADVGLLLRQVQDLDVLLGDRGATTGDLATLRVVPRGADDAPQVDAAIGVERPVLGRDHGGLHRLRHLVEGDVLAVLRREGAELVLAVGVVDVRGLRLEVGVRVRDVDELVEREERDRAEDRAGDDERTDPTNGHRPSGAVAGDPAGKGPECAVRARRDALIHGGVFLHGAAGGTFAGGKDARSNRPILSDEPERKPSGPCGFVVFTREWPDVRVTGAGVAPAC